MIARPRRDAGARRYAIFPIAWCSFFIIRDALPRKLTLSAREVDGRTVFGFSLRATGLSESAALASGISVKKMIVVAMLLSGAVAGLVGMPELLNGPDHAFGLNFPAGIGFTGIAIALLGRNSPLGMVFAALLWAALDASSNSLQSVQVPRELVTIMQGVIVLSVVVAYEFVRRYRLILDARAVASALAAQASAKQVTSK